MKRSEEKRFQGFRKIFTFLLERVTYPSISTLQTPADSMIAKQDILEAARKQAQKRESCYQVKYLKTVGLSVFFLWLLKASHPQIQVSRWLPETLWNQQAACLGHFILVFWPLDSLMDFYFIWVWSKMIGVDFKITDDLWTSMIAFWGILS